MAELPTQPSPTARRAAVWRRLVIGLGVLIGVVVLLIGALQTPPARRYILGKVTTLLAAEDITFSAENFRYNLLGLSTNLQNVRIKSSRLPDAPAFLEIDRARIDVSSWQMLRGRYVVDAADAEGVRVHYYVNEQGVDNLPMPPADPGQSSKPIDYLIADLKVPDASVRYEDHARDIDAVFPHAAVTMAGNAATRRHTITVDANGGDARMQQRSAHLDRVSAVLDLGRDDVKVARSEIAGEGAVINASGKYGPFDRPVADLAIQATADAERAVALAQLHEKISGSVSIEGRIKGPTDGLTIDAWLRGQDLQVRELTGLTIDTAATYHIGANDVRVSRLHLAGPVGTVDGDGSFAFTGTAPSRVNATVEGVNAEVLMRALRLPYRVASRVDGRVDAQWPGLQFTKAAGNAHITLTPTRTTVTASTLPVGGRIDVTGTGTRLNVTLHDVRAAGATLVGQVTLADRDRVDGRVKAQVANVRTTATAIEGFLGRRGMLPVSVAGAVAADGRISGRVSAPVVTARVQAPSLAIGDASGIGVDSDLVYRTDAVAINRLDVTWQEARANATGIVGLTGRRGLDLAVRADALTVQGLLRTIERGDIPASGTLSAQAQVGGTIDSPVANIHLQGADLIAYNETLGALTADARLAGREVDVTALRLDKPQPDGNGTIVATGSYQLDAQRYALDLRSQNIKLLTLQLPDGERVTADLDLTARANGTVHDPAGNLNVRMNDLVVGEYAIGPVAADTTLANAVASTVATAQRLSLTAKSTIGTSAPYPATINAEIGDLDLSALPVKIDTPLEGRLRANVDAQGLLSDPQSGRANAIVERFEGAWHQQPFSIDAPARLRYADQRLTIDQLKLKAQDSTLAVTGNLPLVDRTAPGTINIEAHANLATLAQYAPVGSDVAADGTLTIAGTLQGTLKAIDPNLHISIENGLLLSRAIDPGISSLNATATIANGEATVDRLAANWGTARITLTAQVPLDLLPALPVDIPRQGGPATIHASVQGLDPRSIPGAPEGLSGRISLNADVSSRHPDIREAAGKIAFTELQLGFNNLTLEQKEPSTIAVRDGVASIERLNLGGSVGTLAAKGSIGLTGDRPLDVGVSGALNIAALAIVTDQVRAEGDSTIELSAKGTIADPILSGNVTLRDGAMLIDEPRIAAEAINARVDLDQNRVTLSSLTADVNGGTVTGKGGLAISSGTLKEVDLELATRDFAFDAPLDLRSLSDADLRVTTQGDDIVVSGQVTIQEAGLTGDINFDTGLLASITARKQLELTPQRNPLLERVLFNVDVDTAGPILVDNNLAKAEVTTDLRVVGTPYEPGLLGRLVVGEGGLVTLQEHTYEITRGQVTFLEDRRIFPSFDLQMTTTVNNYDITLAVSGEPGDTETTLTSSPTLPEPDIMAMLVTGRTLDQMRGEEYDVAKEQVLSYLTGRVGSTIGRSLEKATGLSTVRIEPQLIANEADPGARLTLGQDITDKLSLTYSVDLADSDDQIWLATYDVTRRFQTRGVRQADNSYRFDFRHDIRKGGTPEPRRQPHIRPTVGTVAVPEDAPIPADKLRKMLNVEEDKPFDYFSVRNGTEDIEKDLRDAGWAQSRVRVSRTNREGAVDVTLRIVPGPQVEFTYAGMTPPRKVQDEVRQQWHRGVFDAQRTDDAAETLQEWLMHDDYLQAKVGYHVDDSDPQRRRVRFNLTPGPRSSKVMLVFQGASGISPDELDQVINEQKLERQLFTDPKVVTALLQRLYREQGYLNAEIDKPRYEYEGAVARVIVPVREGPQFKVADVTMTGNTAIATPALLIDLPVMPNDPYRPTAAENALQHIRDLYWAKGYNDVRATYQLTVDRIAGRASVAFHVNEGRQAVVAEIRIAGNDKTTEHLVREQIIVKPEEPLTLQALSRSRRNLYDSGAFSIVDLSRETVKEVDPSSVVGALTGLHPDTQKAVVVDATVREVQPYQFRYGVSYDTEGQLGGVFDASVHNVLGKARVAGVASRYDSELREGRIYMSQPTLWYFPIQTTASLYYREERNPATQITDAFNVDRKGVSLQQERKLKDQYVWTYGYRFERARTFDLILDGTPDQLTLVSPLSSAFVRETRDEVLDATRGSFSSHAFQFSPKWLGSDDTYMKYLGQYFHYFPLQSERRKRFSNEIIRPRFVFATGARVGISKGMGTFVPTSERFFAGGSTTLRGFEQNAVGPVSVTGVPIGGDAMLLLNNELRFPLISKLFDGVTFVDIGNVFQRTRDFSFGDLRKTAGVGLRVRTKWVLVRGDYGFVLDRRDGEQKGRFYFSIGQAF
jgi:outer membrane protein assembly complex protein YaeT